VAHALIGAHDTSGLDLSGDRHHRHNWSERDVLVWSSPATEAMNTVDIILLIFAIIGTVGAAVTYWRTH
jgi:hypothetical protein